MRLSLSALFLAAAVSAFGVEAAWLLPPDKSGKTLAEGADFEVGSDGAAWILVSPKGLLRLDKGRAWRVAEAVRDLQFLDGGALVLATDRCVGTLDSDRADPKSGKVPVKEVLLLPSRGFRLGQAGADKVLAYGRNLYSGKFEVYLVGPGASRKVLLQGGPDADAALWHGGKLILAFGHRVLELELENSSKPKELGMLPKTAEALAWVEGEGLAASTEAGVFMLKAGSKPRKIYDCRACLIRAHGKDLYILSEKPIGILRLNDFGGAK